MSSIDELMPGLKVDNILTDTKYRMDSIIKLINLCPREFADIHRIKYHTQADTEPYFYVFFSPASSKSAQKGCCGQKTNQPTDQKVWNKNPCEIYLTPLRVLKKKSIVRAQA